MTTLILLLLAGLSEGVPAFHKAALSPVTSNAWDGPKEHKSHPAPVRVRPTTTAVSDWTAPTPQ